MKLTPKDICPGDELYVSTSLYIDHGEDDVCGGIATVERVVYKPVPGNPVNDYFVYFNGLSHGYNLAILLEDQEKLARKYGKGPTYPLAHDCPDVPGFKCPNPKRDLPIKKKNSSPTRDAIWSAASQIKSR